MNVDAPLALIVASLGTNGLLAGATLDQAIKQVPARHRIGVLAYSDYSRAADLGNGLIWYPALGIGTALLTVAAAVTELASGAGEHAMTPLVTLIVMTVAHMVSTALAAPTNLSQRKVIGDKAALERLFDRFARLNAIRGLLTVLTVAANAWALVALVSAAG